MASDTSRVSTAHSTAEIVDKGMAEDGLSNRKLARALGTTTAVIAAIRSDHLPIPLAWIPIIGGRIGYDLSRLMSLAIAEQGHDMLVAIAESLLWERDAIESEWIELLTEFGGGFLPDPNDVPNIVRALRTAIKDSSSTH